VIALVLAALSLTMTSAHVLELPQKMRLAPAFYAAVNGTLYRWFAIVGGIYTAAAILAAWALWWSARSSTLRRAIRGSLRARRGRHALRGDRRRADLRQARWLRPFARPIIRSRIRRFVLEPLRRAAEAEHERGAHLRMT
jgi:hypothetical protein